MWVKLLAPVLLSDCVSTNSTEKKNEERSGGDFSVMCREELRDRNSVHGREKAKPTRMIRNLELLLQQSSVIVAVNLVPLEPVLGVCTQLDCTINMLLFYMPLVDDGFEMVQKP